MSIISHGSALDEARMFSFGRGPPFHDSVHPSGCTTRSQCYQQLLTPLPWAFDHYLDPAVREIIGAADQSQLERATACPPAKTDTLHPSGHPSGEPNRALSRSHMTMVHDHSPESITYAQRASDSPISDTVRPRFPVSIPGDFSSGADAPAYFRPSTRARSEHGPSTRVSRRHARNRRATDGRRPQTAAHGISRALREWPHHSDRVRGYRRPRERHDAQRGCPGRDPGVRAPARRCPARFRTDPWAGRPWSEQDQGQWRGVGR